MAINLENATGLTAALGNSGFAISGGANAQVSTTTAIAFAIAGLIFSLPARAAAVYASLLDAGSGKAPATILGGKAAMVVTVVGADGVLRFVQGDVVDFPAGSGAGTVNIPVPVVPTTFAPIAYQVIKNRNAAGTAGFVYGVGAFNSANVSFEPVVQIAQLPNAGVYNASV